MFVKFVQGSGKALGNQFGTQLGEVSFHGSERNCAKA